MRTWSRRILASLIAVTAVQVRAYEPLRMRQVLAKQHGYTRMQESPSKSVLRASYAVETTPDGPGGMSAAKQPPLVLDQIRELVPILPDAALAGEIRDRGINFQVSAEIINGLKRAGAGSQTLGILSSFMSNRPPTVMFAIDQPEIQQGGILTLFAEARDPDGDTLQYYWSTSAGTIHSEGSIGKLDTSSITMDANAIQAFVSLTVSDLKGGTDSYSRSITVRRRMSRTSPVEVAPEGTNIQPGPTATQEVTTEGKYTLVHLEGGRSVETSAWGFIEVALDPIGATTLNIRSVTGKLPGVPCRVDIVARENVTEYSFKETPGPLNQWRRVWVRFRPKDSKRVTRFAIYWQMLQNSPVR
jgi:hypothetical protein